MAIPFTSMLKTTISLERSNFEWLGVGNNEVNRYGVGENSVEHTKNLGKLKSKKMCKSQNLAKLGKKSSKIGNLTNFDAIENRPKFLTSDTRTAFNCLWLAFIEAPIL